MRGGVLMADALGFAHAIGVITPSGNLVVERITTRLLQVFPAVLAHYARIGVVGERDPLPDSYDLDGMLAAARLLSHAKPDVILWNRWKGGSIGFAHDADLRRRIKDATGIAATTSGLALVEALARRDVRRVALVTPYAEAHQRRIIARMAEAGIAVVAKSHLGLTDNLCYASVPPDRSLGQIEAVARTRPDAVLTWCTNDAGALVAAEAERRYGVPVLDATTLPLWRGLRLMGCDTGPAAPRLGPAVRARLKRYSAGNGSPTARSIAIAPRLDQPRSYCGGIARASVRPSVTAAFIAQ
jgi:maleate isomerase